MDFYDRWRTVNSMKIEGRQGTTSYGYFPTKTDEDGALVDSVCEEETLSLMMLSVATGARTFILV